MSIGKNIAKFRKICGMTQEELGSALGVTNQAVSKWESKASMPDILLLPKLTEVLKISLYDLYDTSGASAIERENSFAVDAQDSVKNLLYRQLLFDRPVLKQLLKIDLCSEKTVGIDPEQSVGVISYTEKGAAFISDSLSVISSDFDIGKGDYIFENEELFSAAKKLCDNNVRTVMSYLYTKAFEKRPHDLDSLSDFFENNDIHSYDFSLNEVSDACSFPMETVLSATEDLVSIGVIEVSRTNKNTRYIFSKTKAVEIGVSLQLLEQTLFKKPSFGCGYIVGNSFLG